LTLALDTRDKRSSAIHVAVPWRGMYPLPDGTIAAPDRYHIANLRRYLEGSIFNQPVDITFTFGAGVVREAGKQVVAGVSFATTVQRTVAKNIVAGVVVATAIVKNIGKNVVAGVVLASTTVGVKAALQSVIATMSFAGAMARSVSKNLIVSYVLACAFGAKQITKGLNINLSLHSVVHKAVDKILSFGVLVSSFISRTNLITITANLAFSSTINKGFAKLISAGLGFASAITHRAFPPRDWTTPDATTTNWTEQSAESDGWTPDAGVEGDWER
jgi:hypothetical protein